MIIEVGSSQFGIEPARPVNWNSVNNIIYLVCDIRLNIRLDYFELFSVPYTSKDDWLFLKF